MTQAVTLQEWSAGATPEKNDFLSWSNLVLQRSLQVDNPLQDPVSRYFVEQWMAADKDKTLLAPLFERTFTEFAPSFQIQVIERLVQAGMMQSVDLVDHVKRHGPLYQQLMTRSDVWLAMNPRQLRDHIHLSFNKVLSSMEWSKMDTHPVWSKLALFENASERANIFNASIEPKLRNEFGFLNDEKPYFEAQIFHQCLDALAQSWGMHPAQLMYAVLEKHSKRQYEFERWAEFIAPYTNDIKELLSLSGSEKHASICLALPPSSKPVTLDLMAVLLFMSDSNNLFVDQRRPMASTLNPELNYGSSEALSSVFGDV